MRRGKIRAWEREAVADSKGRGATGPIISESFWTIAELLYTNAVTIIFQP